MSTNTMRTMMKAWIAWTMSLKVTHPIKGAIQMGKVRVEHTSLTRMANTKGLSERERESLETSLRLL